VGLYLIICFRGKKVGLFLVRVGGGAGGGGGASSLAVRCEGREKGISGKANGGEGLGRRPVWMKEWSVIEPQWERHGMGGRRDF